MIAPRAFARHITCLLLGTALAITSLSAMAWAGAATEAEATVAVVDLERLAQQIADPQQRDQLMKTL